MTGSSMSTNSARTWATATAGAKLASPVRRPRPVKDLHQAAVGARQIRADGCTKESQ